MKVIADKPTAYFDVDDTLVMWTRPEGDQEVGLVIKNSGYDVIVWPHMRHIELLREFKRNGYVVVVWSQGGSEWAENVVRALSITDSVDLVINKPYEVVDDLDPLYFMPRRIYYPAGTETFLLGSTSASPSAVSAATETEGTVPADPIDA